MSEVPRAHPKPSSSCRDIKNPDRDNDALNQIL
jgi:hypothetical protein